jgi:hypothetical protein
MRPDDLRVLLLEIPFYKIRLYVLEQTVFEITKPELVLVDRSTVTLVSREVAAGYPVERRTTLALVHITRIEQLIPLPTNGH